jgi:hypothetical protein
MTDEAKVRESRSLFHYTNAQGLIGILDTRSLFATHSDYSNDSSECRLILKYLNNQLAEEYAGYLPKLIAKNLLNPKILEERSLLEREAQKSVQAMLSAVNLTAPYFITSFCMHDKDTYEYEHGLLSQWRGYARGGFAIEFDEFGIDALNKEEHAGWRYQGMLTSAVIYEDHEAFVNPKEFAGMGGAFLRNIFADNPIADEILGVGKVEDFGRLFLARAPFIKHYGFSEEEEYRIVAMPNRRTKADPGEKREIKDIHFRTGTDGNVVPYIALYEEMCKPLPIQSIIVGPHARQDNQRLAVELLLERFEVNAAVRVSESTFRS